MKVNQVSKSMPFFQAAISGASATSAMTSATAAFPGLSNRPGSTALSTVVTDGAPGPTLSPPAAAAFAGAQRGSPEYRFISLALFLAGFSTFSLLYDVQPLMPAFSTEFHVGAAASSLSLSVATGCLAISILCAGAVSERLGRRGLMFGSMALAAIFNLLSGIAPTWPLLLLARACEGFALGGVPAVAMAYLAEEIAPSGLGLSMGLYVGGTAFGGMMGRVGMSLLSDFFSWRSALLTIGVIDLAVAIAFVALLPSSRNFVQRSGLGAKHHLTMWQRHLAHKRLPLLFAIGCLIMGTFVTVYNYAGFRLMSAPFNLGPAATGLIFSAYAFGIVASSMAGALADRLGRGPVLVTGVGVAVLGLLLTVPNQLASVICGIVLLTIGFFITHAVASGWVGRMAEGSKGHASSLYLLAYYVGSSVLGSGGGWFWQNGAWPMVTIYTGLLLALCMAAAWALWKLPVVKRA